MQLNAFDGHDLVLILQTCCFTGNILRMFKKLNKSYAYSYSTDYFHEIYVKQFQIKLNWWDIYT